MATYAENLQTARDQAAARLAEITVSPKPSYSVNGQQMSWNEYHSTLLATIEKLNALIREEEGPFEYQTTGFTG